MHRRLIQLKDYKKKQQEYRRLKNIKDAKQKQSN
jgi:hypothetical protein